jgi:hypothetical protein
MDGAGSSVARYLMQLHFIEPDQLADRANDLKRMWFNGLRYDLRVSGMALAPFAVSGLALAAFAEGWHRFRAWVPPLLGVMGFSFAAVAIINYYYYQTYHNHIDLFVFGLAEDTTGLLVEEKAGKAETAAMSRYKTLPKLLRWQLQSRAVGFDDDK